MAVFSLPVDLGSKIYTIFPPPPGGDPYERDGDARRKIRIKPLKKTNLGVAQGLFVP